MERDKATTDDEEKFVQDLGGKQKPEKGFK